MIVLFETPAGFGLFKVLKQGKIENLDDVYPLFSDPTKASKMYLRYYLYIIYFL